eukprot:TRINITY_DN63462_c0_g1_i1.p1 TRINITY_DN63462_c0_g1~~TRINITY_DN63462_c0_g1_i1.p1  ORF type:complete len:286 (+),score=42.22 TRINITY_DN63462_c0_g1_i1:24-860(+)
MEQWPSARHAAWTALAPLLPGAAHAVAIIAVGHPFDTLKTRLQLGMQGSMSSCVWHTLQSQGVKGFYRGAAMPLTQLVVKRPFEFAIWEWFNAKFQGKSYAPALGGVIAGLTSAVLGCPFSVIKIQLQATSKDVHASVAQAAAAILKSRGILGFYRGFHISVYKETPFATVYLGTYGNLREMLPKTTWSPAVAGGVASMITWTVLLPLDTVKTIVQARVLEDSRPVSPWQQLTQIMRDRGIGGLWAGWAPVALRSLPSSAAAMLAYEWARDLTAGTYG